MCVCPMQILAHFDKAHFSIRQKTWHHLLSEFSRRCKIRYTLYNPAGTYTIKNIFGRYSVIRMAIPADGIEIGEELKQNSALSLVPVIRMK